MGFFRQLLDALFGIRRSEPGPRKGQAQGPPPPADPADRIPGTLLPKTLVTHGPWRGRQTVPFADAAISRVLRLKRKKLNYLAYHKTDAYRTLSLPKPGGGTREILDPCPPLKFAQRKILRGILDGVILHQACHGFRREHSILTNARPHEKREVVVCMDLRDFFPSITFPRVFGVFRLLGFRPADAGLFARLTTWNGFLPQGAPTSPQIGNIICRKLDRRLFGLAESLGATYTRYADDLTFSGPVGILKRLRTVRRIVQEEGFSVAEEKTRIMRQGSRQKVCGVVVNERAHLPRETRRRIRAMIHRAGLPEADRKGPALTPASLQGYRALLGLFEKRP
jgi:retron-type reverse transcriptase